MEPNWCGDSKVPTRAEEAPWQEAERILMHWIKQMEVATNKRKELKTLTCMQRQHSKSKEITGNSYVSLPIT